MSVNPHMTHFLKEYFYTIEIMEDFIHTTSGKDNVQVCRSQFLERKVNANGVN